MKYKEPLYKKIGRYWRYGYIILLALFILYLSGVVVYFIGYVEGIKNAKNISGANKI